MKSPKSQNLSSFKKRKLTPVLSAVLLVSGGAALAQSTPQGEAARDLPAVRVVAQEIKPPFESSLTGDALDARRFGRNDTASLLEGTPGLSFYFGGGVSSLPVINGLGDDRLKITVDGMSITSACPNHMNPALSYLDPAALGALNVYAGIVPVSQGGDSIGGAIAATSRPPVFAEPGQGVLTTGSFSAFARSNGDAKGVSLQTSVATENFSLGYTGNTAESDNYEDGKGKEVGASRYKVRNNELDFAARSGTDLYTLSVGWQDIPVQGFPNQAMDMTANNSLSINAAYKGQFDWGALETRAYRQHVEHKMDILREKGGEMPMDTDAVDLGYSIVATLPWSEGNTVRLGHEFHRYTLDDWWPPLNDSFMGPHDFWNIRDGKRDRLAVFAELDSKLSEKLSTLVGLRLEQVRMDTGDVQGYHTAADGSYNSGADSYADSTYKTDADEFNAKNHKRKDLNWDLTAAARYVQSEAATYDVGVSRKTRSPNLHERYTWSNEAMMAGLMNNWFGDLNSYVGDLDLKPEVAYTVKAGADWHDAARRDWQLALSPFYTYVKDYINVEANTDANPYNMSMLTGRQSLRFINEDAVLYGLDLSASKYLGRAGGDWTTRASLSYVRGKTTDGDNLYNIMPLNSRLALDHALGAWTQTLEAVLVDAKDRVSEVRAEQETDGYGLLNYRTRYKLTKAVRVDAGVDNLLNKQYDLPLGGLEYASADMMAGVAPVPVRAMGRSVNVGVTVDF
ncbi:TonB-dependent receptor plug domain-containing protein [Hylemonella gracilis]|uniref:TonB-dependent receptor n=1 Tax=Hylemonella gracilis ATCC 19624 TaxID=887062 RepID=F3KWH4_9BURK|nr:TonB-dependent receptor [Hylemonella gracilis]EGI75881.1 TonB-dependent receptor [Hylemonella gracilis ATCC 19624]